ncbi:MAG: T9SS type A sorting domain-containing protein [Bacteroidota bacterium]
MHHNYPDPFSKKTTICWQSNEAGPVRLDIFNSSGIKIVTLVNQKYVAGKQEVIFDASGLPSGIYFYQLHLKGWVETRKMVLTK